MSECVDQPRMMVMECPSCGEELEVRHSEQLGVLLRRLYFCCESCGYRAPASFEILFSLSPAQAPDPRVVLEVHTGVAPGLRGPVNSRTTKRLRRGS